MNRNDDETNDNIGTIVGIIVGAVALIIIITVIIIIYCCKQKKKSTHVTCMIYMHI